MIKQCACGQTFDAIPADAKFSPDPWLGGHYWSCFGCNSTQFVKTPEQSPAPPSPRKDTEPSVAPTPRPGGGSTCECLDCTYRGEPCHFDCEETLCIGCQESMEAEEDATYEAGRSQGLWAIAFLFLSLSACAPLKASESIRVVYTPANDGTPCYTAYEGDAVKGFSCVQR